MQHQTRRTPIGSDAWFSLGLDRSLSAKEHEDSDLPGSKLTRSTSTKLVDLLRHSDWIETRSQLLDQLEQPVPQVDEGEEE